MRKIMDYYLQQRDDGVGFRLLFDDHTWTDTSYVIPGMKLNYDCDGYSEEEHDIRRLLFELQERNAKITKKLWESMLLVNNNFDTKDPVVMAVIDKIADTIHELEVRQDGKTH